MSIFRILVGRSLSSVSGSYTCFQDEFAIFTHNCGKYLNGNACEFLSVREDVILFKYVWIIKKKLSKEEEKSLQLNFT